MRQLLAILCLLLMGQGYPIPFISGPWNEQQTPNVINQGIIAPLNAFLSGVLPQMQPNASGQVIQPANPNQSVILMPSGTGGIQLYPTGSGNIVLFGNGSTGVAQVANQGSWYKAKGLTPCPGNPGGGGGLGPGPVVVEYLAIQDWLGQLRFLPVC